MHDSLLKVPNSLFYDNKIRTGYEPDPEKKFLYAQNPFLFINVSEGEEEPKGTSFLNREEVDVVCDFIEIIL